MTRRNILPRHQNRGPDFCPRRRLGMPADCPAGIRHEGGVALILTLVRNVGTCRPDAKGIVRKALSISQANEELYKIA
jgi:hypothetical protein